MHDLPVHGYDAVAFAQTGALGGGARLDRGERGVQAQGGDAEPAAAFGHGFRFRRAGGIDGARGLAAVGLAHGYLNLTGFQIQDDFRLCVAPSEHLLAVYGGDGIARLEAYFGGQCVGHHHAHHRAHFLRAEIAEGEGVEQHGQREVGERAGGHHQHTFERVLLIEGVGQVGLGHVAFAGVDHFHIAAQRNRRQAPFDIAPAFVEKRLAEAHGKTQHFDAAPARHQQMPQLVQADQNQDGNDKRAECVQKKQTRSSLKQANRLQAT